MEIISKIAFFHGIGIEIYRLAGEYYAISKNEVAQAIGVDIESVLNFLSLNPVDKTDLAVSMPDYLVPLAYAVRFWEEQALSGNARALELLFLSTAESLLQSSDRAFEP